MYITILDGGMGRELEKMGAPFRQPEWSALALMKDPSYVMQAHTNFLEAGAEVIITNAYAVVPYHIGEEVFSSRGFELAELAAKLAKEATTEIGNQSKVAGCIPPIFGSYRPDLFEADRAPEIYKTLIEAQDKYCDIWLAETIGSIEEFRSCFESITKYSNESKPKWCSFTIEDSLKDGKVHLRSGEIVTDAIIAASETVDAILFNCSRPEFITLAIQEASEILKDTNIQTGAYANAFTESHDTESANSGLTAVRSDLTPSSYLEFALGWINAGATIIGGCCGTGPEFIKAISEHFK